MKELKDYLHLYLPVPVELNNDGSKVYNRVAVAVGNMDDKYRYVKLRLCSGISAFTHSIFFSESNRIKPILRPLSDLKQPDYLELYEILNKEEDNAYGSGQSEQYKRNYAVLNLTGPGYKPTVFVWLLSKHFDLFGLIEAGLAIDKTKIAA